MNEAFKEAVHQWIKEDAPLSMKMTFRAELRDKLLARLEAAEKAAWQPISTAPKDATRVLIWRKQDDPTKGYYVDRPENGGWFDDSEVQLWRSFPPTHWRPLPEPPESA